MDEKNYGDATPATLAYNLIIIAGSVTTICLLRWLNFSFSISTMFGIPIFLLLFWGSIQLLIRCLSKEKKVSTEHSTN